MDKAYNHQDHEENIYRLWEESGGFSPEADPNKKPFTIVMPPPNANDPLHVGHAMFISIEDILIRYHRMAGDASLWLPGTDHAGIETQFVFEKKLAKEGKSRFDFDRTTLYQKIWDYVQENSDVAVNQMKKLGASADWSRFKFTLDADIVNSVLETFEKLYNDDLVYRGERLVNYCVKCGTGYSELEVEYIERKDPLYYIRYKFSDDNTNYIVVATTRPEPIFVDTHLAVNPKDNKNKHLIGKTVLNPLTNQEMEIIADEFVDPEFGTGIVKLTPAHDATDFEAAQKHNLPIIHAIDTNGKMLAGPFTGLKVNQAREETIKYLQKQQLIEKIDDNYTHRVGTCYRCHSVIEPLPLPQFFIKTRSLADNALKALANKETLIHGSGWNKILKDWLTNIKDWNISRQIVWGIRIPVWYSVSDNPNMEVGFLDENKKFIKGKINELLKTYTFNTIEKGLQLVRAPKDAKFKVAKEKPANDFLPETDAFDTWFSSGQWPVVTLQNTKPGDFDYFYPTAVMETGYDILTRWVMRMMLLGIYQTGKSPFKHVYLHGLVRDEQGRKMSKSIGNVINPLDVVNKYGADALRMALVMSTTPGKDSSVGEGKIKGMRNFSNKIWNAARYIMTKDGNVITEGQLDKDFDEKINQVVVTVTKQLENLKIGLAAETIYNEFWHWFCDICIEDNKQGKLSDNKLTAGLITFLKLLHPFSPFVTESVWQQLSNDLKGSEKILLTASWPKTN